MSLPKPYYIPPYNTTHHSTYPTPPPHTTPKHRSHSHTVKAGTRANVYIACQAGFVYIVSTLLPWQLLCEVIRYMNHCSAIYGHKGSAPFMRLRCVCVAFAVRLHCDCVKRSHSLFAFQWLLLMLLCFACDLGCQVAGQHCHYKRIVMRSHPPCLSDALTMWLCLNDYIKLLGSESDRRRILNTRKESLHCNGTFIGAKTLFSSAGYVTLGIRVRIPVMAVTFSYAAIHFPRCV